MNAALYRAASAYANVELETGVETASPHRLILMLFEAALLAVSKAKGHMEAKNVAGKGHAISKAIQIIQEGLEASLDTTQGGELAVQLKDLYDYMCRRLLLASVRNETAGLDEVSRLLGELKDAWASIGSAPKAQTEAKVLQLKHRPAAAL